MDKNIFSRVNVQAASLFFTALIIQGCSNSGPLQASNASSPSPSDKPQPAKPSAGSASNSITNSSSNPISNPAPAPASNPISVSVLALSPATSSLAPGETLQLTVTGGTNPYQFVLSGCDSMISSTGLLTANSDTSQCQVSASDSAGQSATASVSVNSSELALKLLPSSSSIATGSQLQFNASGGEPPYQYSVSGCDSSISNSGLFAAASDASQCLVTVTDSSDVDVTASVAVSIAPPPPKPLIINSPPNILQFGQSAQINVSGGIAPYEYSLTGCDSKISMAGVFLAASDESSCTIVVSDSGSDSASAIIQVITNAVPAITSPHELAFGQSGTVSASGGQPPYLLSISGCDSSLSGTDQLTAAGDASACSLTVTDANGKTSTSTTSIVAPLSVSVPQQMFPFLATGQAALMTVAGGTPPYSFSISSGQGVIVGSYFIAPPGPPSAAPSGQTTIVVTDAYQMSTSITLQWVWQGFM